MILSWKDSQRLNVITGSSPELTGLFMCGKVKHTRLQDWGCMLIGLSKSILVSCCRIPFQNIISIIFCYEGLCFLLKVSSFLDLLWPLGLWSLRQDDSHGRLLIWELTLWVDSCRRKVLDVLYWAWKHSIFICAMVYLLAGPRRLNVRSYECSCSVFRTKLAPWLWVTRCASYHSSK